MRLQDGVRHYYLFEWNKKSDLACRSLVYFLKNKPVRFFENFAAYFLNLSEEVYLSSAIVPPHSARLGVNHAESFAEALLKQNLVSGVLKAGFDEESDMKEQKRKGKSERLKSNRFDLREFHFVPNWIFIDDVLVSGGTFKSISESMFTKPQAIFTLLYKPRLNNKGFYDA